jgi:hypothetical protein
LNASSPSSAGSPSEVVDERGFLDGEDFLQARFGDRELQRVEVDSRGVGLYLERAGRFEDPFQAQADLDVDQRLAFVVDVDVDLALEREVAGERRAGGVFVRRRAAVGVLAFCAAALLSGADRHQQRLGGDFVAGRVRAQAMHERHFQVPEATVDFQVDRFGFQVASTEDHVPDRRVEQFDVHRCARQLGHGAGDRIIFDGADLEHPITAAARREHHAVERELVGLDRVAPAGELLDAFRD